MEKRKLIIGEYDTAAEGWTLSACKLTKGAQVQSFVSVPGRHAPLDVSTYLTDGEPYYENASLEATLECSEGTRAERSALVDDLLNYADGRSFNIVHPDHPGQHLIGRVQITQNYNDLAHCSVAVSAVCEPWLYEDYETVVAVTASSTEKTFELTNSGRLAVVPVITVTGEVRLVFGVTTTTLTAGTYKLPSFRLTTGLHDLTYSGSGTITLTYREAVLAG